MGGERSQARAVGFTIALILAALAAVVLLVLVIADVSLGTLRTAAVPLLGASLVATIVALLGWREERRAARQIAQREMVARERLEDEATGHDPATLALHDRIEELERELNEHAGKHFNLAEVEAELEQTREKLKREREVRARAEAARKVEREWNRELREQVVNAHRERGLLGDTDDLKALVLHIATTLLDAEKGVLLQRHGSDVSEGDVSMEVTCAEGWDNDPRDSHLAKRFAREVVKKDTTIREDGNEVADDDRTDADSEIENLVAIPIYVQDEFSGVIVCANKEGGFHEHDDEVLLAIGDHAGAVLENQRLRGGLRAAYLETVRVLADAIQAKDPHLRGHSEEVVQYVAAVAGELGVEPTRREELVIGSLLHDLGKIGISERILLKPAALTPEERTVIELHPTIGHRLVEQVEALAPIADAILHHHERWDGDGYPHGLAGEDIPLEARIICVADSFSAMTADRPYRRRMTLEDACAELERCAGTQFDPQVVEAFVGEVRKRPPSGGAHPLEVALNDPNVALRREGSETVLGQGPLAITDNLTLLYTHRYFHEVVEQAASRAAQTEEPFAVIVVELTELPQLNRVEGYAAGDEAIVTAGRAMQRAAVRCGGTACRYSGRRLALVCPGCDAPSADRLASELGTALADGPRAAVGCAAWSTGDQGEDVVARARLALTPVPAA
jgi:diguanylate cyclase (GGDEF)-like protein